MLKRRLGILTLVLGLAAGVGYAQRKPVKPAPAAKKVVIPEETVTLGSLLPGMPVSRDQYLKEMSRPLQTAGSIEGFTFMYGERNVYEDSAGNPMVVTDYLTQYCYGDTLPAVIRNTLLQRCKPGDTAFYSGIKVIKSDGTHAPGKALKLPILP